MCPRAIIFIRIIVESWSSRKFPDWSKPREWNHLTPNFRGSLLFEISSGFPTRDRRSLIVAVHRAINFPKVSLNDGKSRWNLAQKKKLFAFDALAPSCRFSNADVFCVEKTTRHDAPSKKYSPSNSSSVVGW